MQILWRNGEPMIASDIVKTNVLMNMNTVQAALRNLMRKSYIQVADVVFNKTALSRSYEPIINQGQYLKTFFPADDASNVIFAEAIIDEVANKDDLQALSDAIAKRLAALDAE